MTVTPTAGLTSVVQVGSQAVRVANGGINGGLITNPLSATAQGLPSPEPLFVDPVGPCTATVAGGTIFALQPGDTWTMIPGQTTPTTVNAASSGHKFVVVIW
jgi:hypothetical protein